MDDRLATISCASFCWGGMGRGLRVYARRQLYTSCLETS